MVVLCRWKMGLKKLTYGNHTIQYKNGRYIGYIPTATGQQEHAEIITK